MMLTGFLRVLAPSGLLLLTATTTTLVQRAGAYSSELTSAPLTSDSTGVPATTTSDTTADTTTDAPVTSDTTDVPVASDTTADATDAPATDGDNGGLCDTELSACFEDETCQSCVTAASSTLQFHACAVIDTLTTSAEGCEANADNACCLDEASEFECLDNEEFAAYWMCILEDNGCAVDEITCDGDESTGVASAGASATTAASLGQVSTVIVASSCMMFTVLLPLLWV